MMGTVCKICIQRLQINKLMSFSQTMSSCYIASKSMHTKMSAWQIHQYGGNEELSLSTTARVPLIQHPKDILVEVHAASVNPIDVRMRGGYGQAIINLMRKRAGSLQAGTEFPTILGRDFSGIVLETGKTVKTFKPGDKVWGALQVSKPGTHAQFTVVSEKEISKVPERLSHVEAASMPYVAGTTWAALCLVGELTRKNTLGKRIFIPAGTGGIGSFAIQLMKAWGADVTTTCNTDAVGWMEQLGATTIDYKTQDVTEELQRLERFDFVLDTLGCDVKPYTNILKKWSGAKYVSIASPLLTLMDLYGVFGGLLPSTRTLSCSIIQGLTGGFHYRWAFFMPDGKALKKIASMVDNQDIYPVVEKIYPFDEVPAAFAHVSEGHARGKIVIQVK